MNACEIVEKPIVHTVSVRFRAPVGDLPRHFSEAYGRVFRYLEEQGLTSSGPAYAMYHNMDMSNLDVEAGFVVAQPATGKGDIHAGQVDAGTYAVCHHTGAYTSLPSAYDTLTQYVAEQGYAPSGLAIEWYLNGPDEVTSQDELRTDVSFPVTRVNATAPQPHE